jgi:predicted ATP-grasp superfamily ATP-dependent carboligase
MKYVGYIESSSFPPLISIHKSEPMPPIRLYCSESSKIVTIFAEFAISIELVYELSETIYSFIKKNGIAMIYSIGGIPMPPQATGKGDEKVAYAVSSNLALQKNIKDAGLKLIDEGVSTGVGALLLSKSTEDKLNNINIMVSVQQAMVDPIYAETAVEFLSKLMKLKIDISDLDKEAKEVEAKIRELINKHKETHENYKKAAGGSGPSMYA